MIRLPRENARAFRLGKSGPMYELCEDWGGKPYPAEEALTPDMTSRPNCFDLLRRLRRGRLPGLQMKGVELMSRLPLRKAKTFLTLGTD